MLASSLAFPKHGFVFLQRVNGNGNFIYFYVCDQNTYVQAEGATTGDFAGDVMFKIKGKFTDLDLYKLMTYSFDAEIHYLENNENH